MDQHTAGVAAAISKELRNCREVPCVLPCFPLPLHMEESVYCEEILK